LVPIGGPFPDVADHVVKAVAVRRKRRDRRGALVAVERQVLAWERALPRVRHLLAARRKLVSPGELGAVEPPAGRELPLGLRGQFFAGPFGVGLGVAMRDMYDRMVVETADRSARPVRAAPVGAALKPPAIPPGA